jgi:hypothetical protein
MLEYSNFQSPSPHISLPIMHNWERISYCLFCLSKTGFSTFQDLQHILLPAFHHLTSIKRLFSQMDKLDLLITDKVVMPVPPRYFSLKLIRLSEKGRKLCNELNFDPVMSDWDDLIRYHERGAADQRLHTACVLYAAYLARQYGWIASAMPNVTTAFTQARPDLIVFNERESYYVEVETETRRRKKFGKWREVAHMAALEEMPFGFCVPSVKKRIRLLEDCRRASVSLWYTDFETLNQCRKKDSPGNFWLGNFQW